MKGIDHTCGSSSPDLSDGGSAVTVLRADGNANAPESGGDRDPGHGVQLYDAFVLKMDVRFCAGSPDRSNIYPRDRVTFQPTIRIMNTSRPRPSAHSFGFDSYDTVPAELLPHIINDIRTGQGFTIDILHEPMPRIGSVQFDERHFLAVLINVLHRLMSLLEIGLDYPTIVRHGILCEENKLEPFLGSTLYQVSITFPMGPRIDNVDYGWIKCVCRCESLFNVGYQSRIQVVCTVNSCLPSRPKDVQFSPTGNAIYRSGLGDVGFFTILSCLHDLDAVERVEQTFRVVEQPNSLMASQLILGWHPKDAALAFVETVKQCMAIENIKFDLDSTIVPNFSQTVNRVEFEIPLLERLGRKVVRFEFTWSSPDGFGQRGRKKGTARHHGTGSFRPAIRDFILVVSRTDDIHPDTRFRMHTEDEYAVRTAYLQRCFHQRGLMATERSVRDMLDSFQRKSHGHVQLIFDNSWCPSLVFLNQNKNKLLDMIEDTVRTVLALTSADFSLLQIELSGAQRDFPPHQPLDHMRLFFQANDKIDCLIKQDGARNIVLDVCYYGRINEDRLKVPKALGGIVLAQAAEAPAIQNEQQNVDRVRFEEGEDADDSEEEADDLEEEDDVEDGDGDADSHINSDADPCNMTGTEVGASAEVKPSTSSSFQPNHRLISYCFGRGGELVPLFARTRPAHL